MNNKIVIILGALAVAISIGALAMSISQDKTINVTSSNAPAVQGGGATTNETLSTSKVEREVVNAINAPAKLNGRAKCVQESGSLFDCQYLNAKATYLVQARADDTNVVVVSLRRGEL